MVDLIRAQLRAEKREPPIAERALDALDWGALSPQAQWTARIVAAMLSDGWLRSEVAAFYAMKPSEISARMARLRAEIEEQLGEE